MVGNQQILRRWDWTCCQPACVLPSALETLRSCVHVKLNVNDVVSVSRESEKCRSCWCKCAEFHLLLFVFLLANISALLSDHLVDHLLRDTWFLSALWRLKDGGRIFNNTSQREQNLSQSLQRHSDPNI